jgi:hypothetical protein
MKRGLLALLVLFTVAACGGPGGGTPNFPEGSAIATFRTPDGATYRVLFQDPADVARLEEALAGDGNAGIPTGRLQPGDGGVNEGHDWHVVEAELVDMAMEICDGSVSYLDDLGYERFVAEHSDRFCPWLAEVVEVERV